MDIDPTIKEEMTLQVKLQQAISKVALVEGFIESQGKEIQSLNEEIEGLKHSLALAQNLRLFCLNCEHCRYSEEECICNYHKRKKVYIKPDEAICEHFNPKQYEDKS